MTMQYYDIQTICKQSSILIVEDELISRETHKEMLSDVFGNVVICENGHEALNRFMQEKFEMVLTDINMPLMNGLELARNIREIDPDQPLVVISSVTDKNHLIDLINIGITRFCAKPIDYGILISMIEDILQARHYADAVKTMQEHIQEQHDTMARINTELQQKNEDLEQHIRILETRSEQFNRLVKRYMLLKKQTTLNDEKKTSEPEPASFKEEKGQAVTHTLHVEHFFDSEKLHDLEEHEQEMDSTINIVLMSQEIRGEKIFQLAAIYREYSGILRGISRFIPLADSMVTLAESIEQVNFDEAEKHKDVILQHLESFTFTLINWRSKAFSGQLRDVNLFDQSLMVDVQTICLALKGELNSLEGEIEFF